MYFKTKYLECEICKSPFPLSVKIDGKYDNLKKITWYYRNWETYYHSLLHVGNFKQGSRFALRTLYCAYDIRRFNKISKIMIF